MEHEKWWPDLISQLCVCVVKPQLWATLQFLSVQTMCFTLNANSSITLRSDKGWCSAGVPLTWEFRVKGQVIKCWFELSVKRPRCLLLEGKAVCNEVFFHSDIFASRNAVGCRTMRYLWETWGRTRGLYHTHQCHQGESKQWIGVCLHKDTGKYAHTCTCSVGIAQVKC